MASSHSSDLDSSMRNVSLSALALQKLQARLRQLGETDAISLADSFIGDSGCELLVRYVREHPSVTALDLRGNNIGAEGVQAIGELLKQSTSLVSLSLEWNNAYQGLHCLAAALTTNTSLRSLDLRNNKLGPEAATQLAQSLRSNSSLSRLDLRWNEISLQGVRAFTHLLESKLSGLKELELSGNKAPEEAVRLAESLLKGEPLYQEVSPKRRPSDFRNRSSGSFHRRDTETLSQSRYESQIADLEFALEQERKRNADLAAALAVEQEEKHETECRCVALQEASSYLQGSLLEEKQGWEESVAGEKVHRSAAEERTAALQLALSKQEATNHDLEERVISLQDALEKTQTVLTAATVPTEESYRQLLDSERAHFTAQLSTHSHQIQSLEASNLQLTLELTAYKEKLSHCQSQSQEALIVQAAQLHEDESKRFHATFYSIDQKLKSVQELRATLAARCESLQRDIMKGEKKSVEHTLAFEAERESIIDQTREMAAVVRDLQGEVGRLRAENDRLKRYCEDMEVESERNRSDLGDQTALFQAKMSEMMGRQREERTQWEQQHSSTLQRIRALESELQRTAGESRRALDTFVLST